MEMKRIQQAVRKSCAYHKGATTCLGRVDLTDKRCVFFIEGPEARCSYFEKAVLPQHSELLDKSYAEQKHRARPKSRIKASSKRKRKAV